MQIIMREQYQMMSLSLIFLLHKTVSFYSHQIGAISLKIIILILNHLVLYLRYTLTNSDSESSKMLNNIVLDSDEAIQFACKYPREVSTEAEYDVKPKGDDIEETSEGVLNYEMTVTDAEAGGTVNVQIKPLHSLAIAANVRDCTISFGGLELHLIHSFKNNEVCLDKRLGTEASFQIEFVSLALS